MPKNYREDIDILSDILKLRERSCKEFTACDICPFSVNRKDEDIYDCSLATASVRLLGGLIDIVLEEVKE